MWDENKNGHRMWDDRNFNGKMKKLQVERASEDKRKQTTMVSYSISEA